MSTLPPGIGFLFFILVFIIPITCLYGALRYLRQRRLIQDTPTLKTQGVFIGLVELSGTAESEKPLTSYLTEKPCVQYNWQIEEHWSRQVVETYRDADGKTQTRTRTESGWTDIGHRGESIPFYLKDDTGVIRVLPEKASIDGETVIDETFRRGDAIYFSKGPFREVANSDHRRRFRETMIPLHSNLYIIGQARERQDLVAAEIAYDEEAPLYVISTNTEKEVSTNYSITSLLFFIIGLIAAVIGVRLASPSPEILVLILPSSIYLLAAAAGWIWVVYNSLVSLSNSVDQAWSLIEIQLKRRADLIPNLVKVVEGYHIHEEAIHSLEAELREQALQPVNDENLELKGITPILQLTSEKYPNLFASDLFLRLQRSLEETEQRIALARDYFNEIAYFYNTRLIVIPDTFVGKIAGLRPKPLLSAKNFERANIDISLVD